MKVLHIAESFSAGVATAIEGYADHTTGVEHVVLGYRRPGIQLQDAPPAAARLVELPPGKPAQYLAVCRAIRAEQPDVIHAHSSWAGLYVRLAPTRRPIVYTPHCFAFERTDVSPVVRRSLLAAEWLLARRPQHLAACSEHEATVARTRLRMRRVSRLPYVLPLRVQRALDAQSRIDRATPPLRVATVGRLGPQKGVDFHLRVVESVATAGHTEDFAFVWIGGGDDELAQGLTAHGVTVTGWQPQADALATLAGADVLLHTAAWEGMPLTVLEALHLGLPVVAREIPALGELHLATTAAEPDDVARMLIGLLEPARRQQAADQSQAVLAARPSGERYGHLLEQLYADASGT